MEWPRADGEMPNRTAARVKLRYSATVEMRESSASSFLFIAESFSQSFAIEPELLQESRHLRLRCIRVLSPLCRFRDPGGD